MSGDVDVTAHQCKIVDSTTVAGSVKAKLVSARAWLATLQSEPTATCWLALVRSCDGQKEPEGGEDQIDAQYVALCDEFQDVFQTPGLAPHRALDHAIDLVDENATPPHHK